MPTQIGGRLTVVAQIAGLIATACFVWIEFVVPRLFRQSLGSMVVEASGYVVLAWICAAAITFCIYVIVSLAEMPDVIRFSLRTTAPAMWFAPAIILLFAPGPASLFVGLILLINASRLLVHQWLPQAEASVLSGTFPTILITSFTLQVGLVALLFRHLLTAAILVGAAAAILTALAIVTGASNIGKPSPLPHSSMSVALTFALAVVLSIGGIQAGRPGRRGSGHGSGNSDFGTLPTRRITRIAAPPDDGLPLPGSFSGVILSPEVEPRITLVAPPALLHTFGAIYSNPVNIPFSGEYWVFRPPFTRPPLSSVVRRGTPAELGFRTVDGAPIEMEAHQKFDPPVDLSGCHELQLVITDADRYAGPVTLELILISRDEDAPGGESLGKQTVASRPGFEQSLKYRLPQSAALSHIGEIKVVFHRDPTRTDKSARIALRRFVVVP